MEFTTKFSTKLCESFSSGVYLTNYSSESIHIWNIGTLEGLGPYLESNLSRCYGVVKARFPLTELPVTMTWTPKKLTDINH